MDKLSLILSLLAVILGSVAYWRAGGEQDVTTAGKALRDELTALKAKQDELLDDLASEVQATYERAQEGMTHARQRLSSLLFRP
ncbi:MAG TPA: hypothetical protein VNH11_30685 [Pirellulales bacterium]|nr:hypothetical protein [Pirellulales bacterium]